MTMTIWAINLLRVTKIMPESNGSSLLQPKDIEYSWGTSNDSHCIKNKYEINDD